MTSLSPTATNGSSKAITNISTQPATAPAAPAPAPETPKSKMKLVTIQLSTEVHQKLRIVALSKGATTSGLVEAYVESALKKDLVLAVAKLSE